MTRVRRHLPRALWCAGLGLCATVAVSWACALWSPLGPPSEIHFVGAKAGVPNLQFQDQAGFGLLRRIAITELDTILIVPPNDWPRERSPRDEVEEHKDMLLRQIASEGKDVPRRDQLRLVESDCQWVQRHAWEEWQSGWPARSIVSLKIGEYHERKYTGINSPSPHPGLTPPKFTRAKHDGPRILPAFPLWGGLFIDSALYGTVAWCSISAVDVFRRWKHARRGRCAECGYELAGLTKCPECGTDSPSRGSTSSVSLFRSFAVSLGFSRVASLLPLRSNP